MKNALRQFGEAEVNDFLRQGAFINWNRNHWMVFWGRSKVTRQQPAVGVYVSDFFQDFKEWHEFENWALVKKSFWSEWSQNKPQDKQIDEPFDFETEVNEVTRTWEPPNYAEFEGYFNEFKKQYKNHGMQKVVPVVFSSSSGDLDSDELLMSLIKLSQCSEGLQAYGFWQNGSGFLGATPENLFTRLNDYYATMALAGTAKRSKCTSLAENAKEKSEHNLVIEGISQSLKQNNLKWGKTYEWPIGNLVHLRTDASFTWESGFSELIEQLHPTPALGGFPRQPNLDYLRTMCDKNIRRFFGAPFGVAVNSQWLCLVAIRNVQWFEGNTYLGSGCGLVKDSQLNDEWNELQAKRDFTLGFLDL